MPSAAPGNRRLRVPIRGLLSAEQVKAMMERQLAAEASNNKQVALYQPSRQLQATQTPFDLQVALENSKQQEPTTKSTQGGSNAAVIAIVVVILALIGGCLAYFFCCRKKKHVVEEQEQHKVVVTSQYYDHAHANPEKYGSPQTAY